ncbi:hypothetical protein D9619_011804 [Psilocybe cf. subviscida]|uniref:BAG domain-containing protein n=1 Tax=Psilocybe cf. subviscida TaxID=2480587 RepID=A0A8H5B076_9AGAR|nr:hypothetical protein D9619_011804 [Psilocybe cf. subviscida]
MANSGTLARNLWPYQESFINRDQISGNVITYLSQIIFTTIATMYGQPWYSGYPTYPVNGGFNPYIHPAYARASPYDAPLRGPAPRSTPSMRAVQDERARALAERRARRARYLPDEDDEMEDYGFWPSQWGPQQSELAAKARQEDMERRQREEELRRQEQEELRQRQLEQHRRRQEEEAVRRQEDYKRLQEEAARKQVEDERRRQAALEQQQQRREELARKYMEEQEARQRMIEEQKNLIRLRREEEARRLLAGEQERRSRLAEQEQRAASRSRSREPTQDNNTIPIHFHRSTGPQPTNQQNHASHPASPASASPKSAHTFEERNEAASRIQQQYRIHRTYRKLEDIRTQFDGLKKDFVYPHLIDFEKPGSADGVLGVGAYRVPSDFDKEDMEPMQVDNVPEGKLAYTSTNFALNLYSDQLDKLLMKLDGIESYGEKGIREQRRAAVKAIEKEASKLDRYCKQTWLDYVEKQRQGATPSKPAQQSASDQPADAPTEQASSTEPSKIPISSHQTSTENAIETTSAPEQDSWTEPSQIPLPPDTPADQPSTETVSYPMDIEIASNTSSADTSSSPSPSPIREGDASESENAPGAVKATGDGQPEPQQEGATGTPAP